MSKNINSISYSEALQMIRNELIETMQDNYNYYRDLKIIIANEQEFIKTNQRKPNAVYVVLRYGATSINFGQSVLPITITVMAEQNNIDIVQNLLVDFVAKFNLTRSEDNTIQQIFEAPTVTSNFNKVFEGFRSVMYVSGFLVVSKTANFFSFYYTKPGNLEIIKKVINETDDLDNDGDLDNDDDLSNKNIEFAINEEILFNKISSLKEAGSIPDEKGEYRYVIDRTDGVETWHVQRKNALNTFVDVEEVTFTRGYVSSEYGISYTIDTIIPDELDYNFELLLDIDYKSVDYITTSFGGDTQLDTQAFYNVTNFTRSVAKTGTITFSLTTYFLSDIEIAQDASDVYFKVKPIDTSFPLKINRVFGEPYEGIFKLASCNINSEIGQLPMITMTFTE